MQPSMIRYLVLGLLLAACESGGPSGPGEDGGTVTGNVARFQGVVLTLESHQEPWTDWEFEFMAPDPGHHYYTVLVTVQNGSGAQITVNPLDFQLEYGGSVRVDREGGYREPAFGLANVVPPQAVSGWLVFQVPDGAVVTGIHWSPRFDVTLEVQAGDVP